MLTERGDAVYRFLDFTEAEPGDRFYRVTHLPYSDTVRSIDLCEVSEVRGKRVVCRPLDSEKSWIFFQRVEQQHYYLPEDPFLLDLLQKGAMIRRIEQAKKWIKAAEIQDFDEILLQAI
ncbi:MAG: hypothetical protein ACP5D5_09675, partial [Acidithiobacillus sp.]|uniref:hypothetical protein n=1 Tax=Acidithiobacillus sp. TaxID=1872118 RepID=UPI003CFC9EDB